MKPDLLSKRKISRDERIELTPPPLQKKDGIKNQQGFPPSTPNEKETTK